MPRLKPQVPPPPPPALQTKLGFDVDEAAEIIGISRATLYRLMKNKEITPKKVGRRTLIPRAEIDRCLASA